MQNSRSSHVRSMTVIEDAQNDKKFSNTAIIEKENKWERIFDEKHSEKSKEQNNVVLCEITQDDVVSSNESTDEGWQEATSKGRSGYSRKNFHSKRKDISKLTLSNSQPASFTGSSFKKSLSSKPAVVTYPAESSCMGKAAVAGSSTSGEKADKLQSKTSDTDAIEEQIAKASATGKLAKVASKLVSYKEVAISPPGTVLKPTMEQKEEEKEIDGSKENRTLIETLEEEVKKQSEASHIEIPSNDSEQEAHSSDVEISNVVEKIGSETIQDLTTSKIVTTNGSKLSASAPPFNPGSLLSMSRPYTSFVRRLYDTRVPHQMIPPPLEILSTKSVNSRVPCGPRSTQYYRTGHAFRRKQHFRSKAIASRDYQSTSTMNPHAAEFIPAKAWEQQGSSDGGSPEAQIPTTKQKQQVEPLKATDDETSIVLPEEKPENEKGSDGAESMISKGKETLQSMQRTELARQILFSFIVRSVRDSFSSPVEAHSNMNIPNPSRTIKTNAGNTSNVANSGHGSKAYDQGLWKHTNKDRSKDTEGFTMVSKRRRSKQQQYTEAANGLYTQQSICT